MSATTEKSVESESRIVVGEGYDLVKASLVKRQSVWLRTSTVHGADLKAAACRELAHFLLQAADQLEAS